MVILKKNKYVRINIVSAVDDYAAGMMSSVYKSFGAAVALIVDLTNATPSEDAHLCSPLLTQVRGTCCR